MTLGHLIDYHRAALKPDVRPTTAAGYEHSYKHFRNALGDGKPIDTITPADLGKLKSHLQAEGDRPATIHKVCGHLRALLNLAVRDHLLARNPLNALRLGKVEPKVARIYTKTEVRAMLAKAPSTWWKLFVKLAFTSGLRLGELLALEWSDLELDAGLVHVKPKVGGTVDVDGDTLPRLAWSPKTQASKRSVPIPEDTVAVLKAHYRQADEPTSSSICLGCDSSGSGWRRTTGQRTPRG